MNGVWRFRCLQCGRYEDECAAKPCLSARLWLNERDAVLRDLPYHDGPAPQRG